MKVIGKLSQFRSSRILLVGDFMLDTYTTGNIKRISPEAPVPVLHVSEKSSRPGGAGNAALNMVSLGARVKVAGRIGDDAAGQALFSALETEGIDCSYLWKQKTYATPVKNRLIANFQQLLRVDFETFSPLCQDLEEKFIDSIDDLIHDCQVIAISDYAKGFLTKPLLKALIQRAKELGILVVVDPKGDDFTQYAGASVIKPNNDEVYKAAKLSQKATLEQVASTIHATCAIETLLITRSEHGMTIFDKELRRTDFPVRAQEVKDVTGAGDTVLAVIAASLASGISLHDAAIFANVAASIAIEKVGCIRVNLADIAERLLALDMESKIFDEEHLFALKHSLQGKKITILGIDSEKYLSVKLFQKIKEFSAKNSSEKLIIYLCDQNPPLEFVNMLASIKEVDFVVIKKETLRDLSEILKADRVYYFVEEQILEMDHPIHLLERNFFKNLRSSSLGTVAHP